MSKVLDKIGKIALGPLGSALNTGEFDLANSLPGVLFGAKTRQEKAASLAEEEEEKRKKQNAPTAMRKGGKVQKYSKGGSVTRGDDCAKKGHTKGRMR